MNQITDNSDVYLDTLELIGKVLVDNQSGKCDAACAYALISAILVQAKTDLSAIAPPSIQGYRRYEDKDGIIRESSEIESISVEGSSVVVQFAERDAIALSYKAPEGGADA